MWHEEEIHFCGVIPLSFRVNESSKKELARDEAGVVGKGWIREGLWAPSRATILSCRQWKMIESFCLGLSVSDLHFN